MVHAPLLTQRRAFLRNPAKYPDPDNFRPERWLEAGWPTYQEPLSQYPTIKGMSSFGWGQRACLGQTLTQDELLIACGSLVWAFVMKHKKDSEGKDIPIDLMASNSLLIIKPDPFQMAFEPRNEAKRQQIIEQWKEAEAQEEAERAAFLQASRSQMEAVKA